MATASRTAGPALPPGCCSSVRTGGCASALAGACTGGACRRRVRGGAKAAHAAPSAEREAELAALQPPRRRSAPHFQQWRLRPRAAAAAAPGAVAAPRAPSGLPPPATQPSAACRVRTAGAPRLRGPWRGARLSRGL